jgi:very-short-patch-repair endonuclease
MTKIHNRKYLKEDRRSLRNNLTSAEATLWNSLKNRQLKGRKFRREHSVGNYILDFYCPGEKLAVELDGDYHFEPSGHEYDKVRDAYLNDLDIKVIHIENDLIFFDIDYVLKLIADSFTTPNPS